MDVCHPPDGLILLLFVGNRSWRGIAQFDPIAHFLDVRVLLFDSSNVLKVIFFIKLNSGSLLLIFAPV